MKRPRPSFRPSHHYSRLTMLITILTAGLIGVAVLKNSFAACDPTIMLCGVVTPPAPPPAGGEAEEPDPPQLQPSDNPPIEQSCQMGLDVAMLIDTSGSMSGTPLQQARDAMRSFITNLKGQPMTFAIGTIDQPSMITNFTADTTQAISDVDTGTTGGGGSYLGDLQPVLDKDPRPDVQNFIIILTDGQIGSFDTTGYQYVKQTSTRLLAIGVGYINTAKLSEIAGPNVNTGSIWTSDVITTNFDQLGQEFKDAAKQLCQVPAPVKKPGTGKKGTGKGDKSNGTGKIGKGTGKKGTGKGDTGKGTGKKGTGKAGGSTAPTTPSDKPNPAPKPSPQGEKKEKPPKQKPSPFFDGKKYEKGSEDDPLKNKSPQQVVESVTSNHTLLWVIGGTSLAALGGGGYIIWRRRK